MKIEKGITRRTALKGPLLGLVGVSVPLLSQQKAHSSVSEQPTFNRPHDNYPYLNKEIVAEVVMASHFDLERVKALVDKRPELARATWEWRFGDFESAVEAASHVGRRDIVQYLLSKGAKPNILTYASLGAYDAVKSMIEYIPGIQTTLGPHGISLLRHARAALRMQDKMSRSEIESSKQLIGYLESLGDANGEQYDDLPWEEKQKYLGDYKYGDADDEVFTVGINIPQGKLLSLATIGAGFGGALYKIGDGKFIYNGAASVIVSFQFANDQVKSLTITEPDLVVVAHKMY